MQKIGMQGDGELAYYYSVRLLIRHPTLLVREVSEALGMEPHHYWNAGERDFTQSMMWSLTSWTEGKRLFFDEIYDVLLWLQEKQDFVSHMRASGGDLQIIVQLPGAINIGDTLSLDALPLAAKLGVSIGVEVFPNLVKPASDE
ncbi:MAG: hypothetical protein EOP37_05500 [Rubrivivax sp.]|nr:MAG: hypothetical protein EOP37_05500 [Rubrivivax sp.]